MSHEPIAIVGSGCRFPGESSSPSKLWNLLRHPRDVSSKIDRFAAASFYHKNGHYHGASNVLDAYLLSEDTRLFDAQLFNIQGGEAASMDPQQRLLIEVVYEALELAGLNTEELSGTDTGVYVGVMCNDFSQLTYSDLDNIPKYAATGTALSILSNRLSYFFNWKGPSMTIDTACSSSLIAVHQAVQLLRSGQSRVAVAAGSNLIFSPTNFIAESNLNMLSPTGRSRMWDNSADGYARGEGVGCVILKRLSDAIADGDDIECIIRETGVNQDGRTPGITMPSSDSQAELIRQTYARAGLNPLLETDRCQYFEAHGTGTKAGDPQEASAIHKAFASDKGATDDQTLYVGSIKTVIGHTEGTAGIAGLLKASLSIQNGTIPANMLFNELNPAIEPYYGFLQIPTTAKPWPKLPPGVPRRASVNSFGFGGANAHAIIESYTPAPAVTERVTTDNPIPILFSANSEKALITQIRTWMEFLEQQPSQTIDIQDLAWTLSRRSALSQRACFVASCVPTLLEKLKTAVEDAEKKIGVRTSAKKGKIFGIFTGQGAQWPAMGRGLVQCSPVAEATLKHLDASLQALPEEDRPSWSLHEELFKTGKESRLMEAEFSQPLCTAVQILLTDMLRAVGVTFEAVVGHSSGEIGAAYTCDYLSAWDAIRVAYLRGRVSHVALANGAMLAVGTSLDDATELCSLPIFRGRLTVAASNSSSSVTLSGDRKAVEKAQMVLDDEGKFTRMLKVDKAYHSHHMEPCSEPYMEAMSRAGIRVLELKDGPRCRWFSSVLGGTEATPNVVDLSGPYWKDNLVQPVLFSQALDSALASTDAAASLGLVVEVGPHPALKGPASSVIEESCGAVVPYTGVLARSANDVEALSAGIGAVWCNIPSAPTTLSLGALASFFSGSEAKPGLLKSVPTYTWDHSRAYFTESRITKKMLSRPSGHHELLGVRLDGGPSDYRWRNFIKHQEMPWLRGHQIQGQMVFPGAGFASMAVEALKAVVDDERVALLEILDLQVSRAMSLNDDSVGVEILVTLSSVVRDEQHGTVTCDFECSICPDANTAPFAASTARIRLEMRDSDDTSSPSLALAERLESGLDMNPVNVDLFYTTLASSGYNYSDMFRSIRSIQRTTDKSSGVIHVEVPDDYDAPHMTLHPAPLDVAFQTVFGALGSPGDGRLWTTLVPTKIARIKIDPHVCKANSGLRSDITFDAFLSASASKGISGDVDMFNATGQALVQIEGLSLSPLSAMTPQNDRQMVSKMAWGPEKPDATRNFTKWQLENANLTEDAADFIQRACFFYMKCLHEAIPPEERATCEWHQRKYLAWVADTVEEVAAGQHPIIRQEWMHDTLEMMGPMVEAFRKDQDDFSLIIPTIGENLIPWARGELNFLELYRESNILEHIYKNTVGFTEFNEYLGQLVGELAHRFQQMDILELGAGTGSATEAVMRHIGERFRSYAYTDISSAFFPKAENDFKKYAEKFTYSTLDIERDPTEQQYLAHNYDLIVVSNVLHATKSLETTLCNVRKLLKPGGYLVFLEITDMEPVHPTFVFGTIAGWWVGENDGRRHHPLITKDAWAELLQKTGFSGLDTATPASGQFMAPQGVMLSQAVDTQMELIRQPFSPIVNTKPALNNLLIIGGKSMAVFQLIEEIEAVLLPLANTVSRVERFDEIEESHFTENQMILCLVELEDPIFDPFTPAKWKAMQVLTEKARNVVWVTQGGLSGAQPYGHMMTGVARCLTSEKPSMMFQLLDFDAQDVSDVQSTIIAEAVLRMQISNTWSSLVEPYTPTWTLEREVRIGLDGTTSIPRYLPNHELDARYNASRRVIRSDRVPGDEVTIVDHRGVYELERVLKPEWALEDQSLLQEIQFDRSLLTAVTIDSVGALFLGVGKLTGSSQSVVALSSSNSSRISTPASWTISCDAHSNGVDPSLLVTEAIHACWIEKILSVTPNNTVILVHEPPTLHFASALRDAAAERHLTIHFTTSRRDNGNYTFIHPSRHDRALSRLLPSNLSTFVNMSGEVDLEGIAARMQKQLPSQCSVIDLSALMAKEAFIRPSKSPETVIPGVLDRVSRYLLESSTASEAASFDEIPIAQVAGGQIPLHQKGKVAVLNWSASPAVPLRTYPAEDIVQFRSDKTYLLIGLAGQLGISMCDWMAQRGARHIVITSRNPKVNKAWLDNIQADGVQIRVESCDATDRRSVLTMYQSICKTMPPIVGVCNGAMIMNDGIIPHMTYERFNQSLRPKVDGTRFLDEIFNKPNLDFFVVFSSLAYVTGNLGQSPYAAANAFMVSIVEGRRARGLAGSILNLAGISGLGYISRTDLGILDRLAKLGYSNMSEWDFLQFFAESVLAGKPGSQSPIYDISSSLHPYDVEQDDHPPAWLPVPAFSYYKRTTRRALDAEDSQEASVRIQLKQQTTKEGVATVLQAGLSASLYKLLNIRPEDNTIRADTRLVDLGIDSLVAVDMRSWFSKELDLDMPVLKLLGGATVEEMVQDTMERLSPSLTPKLKAESGDVPEKEESSPHKQDDSTSGSSPSSSTSETRTPSETGTPSSPSSMSDDGKSEDEKSIVDTMNTSASRNLVFEQKQSMGYPSLQFWFLLQQQELLSAFNCTFRIGCRGPVDIDRMSKAVKTLGERHGSMRTAFFDDASNGYEPTQATLAPSASPLRLETRNVSNLEEAVKFTDDLQQRYVFDLNRGEVVRIALLSENDQTHYLIIGIHHIAIDGYSFFLFLKELIELYAGRQLEPVQTQWSDMIKEQKLAVDNGSLASEVAFWKKQLIGLHGVPEPLPMLPFAKVQTRVPVSTFKLEEVPMVALDPAAVRAVRERCRKLKVTRFHFFMTVLRNMLMELSGADELCIGMVDAGRSDVRSTKLVGLMANVLPLRFQKKSSQSFSQICRDVRDQAYMALAHSCLPFKAMLEQLGVPLSNQAAPIFQVMMDYLPQKFETPAFAGTTTDEIKSHLNYSMTDMILNVNDFSETEIKLRWSAQTDLYSREAVQTLMNTYVKLIERFATSDMDCAAPMSKIEGMLELYNVNQVKDAMVTSLGNVEPEHLRRTAFHIIQEMSLKNPDAIALKDGSGVTLTYSQMARRVRQIELALLHPQEKLERVACYQQPTVDWVCSLLAVWKAGATYISLDSRLPESRISTLLDLSKPSAILCCPETFEVTKTVARDCRVLDVKSLSQIPDIQVDIESSATLDSPALIIFTSGSTGTPKCVEINHSSLVNVIQGSLARHCNPGESLIALQQSAVSFDLCFGQVLMGLCSGGTLMVASRDQRSDPQEICKIIRDESISFVIATPSELAYWFRYGKAELNEATGLRYAFSGGEALPATLKTSFRQLNKDVKLVNVFGPAEASVWCTTAEIDYSAGEKEDVAIPVGRPMANCAVFVVDKNLKPVPSGVSGEIAVTGAGVANGYFGQEELTRAAFLADSLTPTGHFSHGAKKNRMYRTGDSGRFGTDGQLYYEGRIKGDSQVKLNGIRIEIREVESSILRASQGVIGNVVVSVRRDPDFLVGHVELEPGYYGPQEQQGFLESLVTRLPLPKYMCPAVLVPVDRIPMNAHGKTDRLVAQALPIPSVSHRQDNESPVTSTEKAMLEIWTEVLPSDLTQAVAVRPETDFFSLGGGSYLLVRVQRLILDRFGVSIPVRELFGTSTLREMASCVDAATAISAIDWQAETALDGISGDDIDASVTAPVKTADMTVVLTGATGYLGKNLLKALLENPAVSTVHCVAVRDATRVPQFEITTAAKIVIHTGNLGAPLLGLSAAAFDKLANSADVLIHSGADRSFWDSYQTLRSSNVASTKTMIQMAARRLIPLHFISSGGLVTKAVPVPAAESITGLNSPPIDGSNGYIATKWASEACLEQAARSLDIPVSIHRVTSTPSSASPAQTTQLRAELQAELRSLATKLNAVPQSGSWRGTFDVLRTSTLSASLAASFVRAPDETVRFFHYPSEMHLDIDGVAGVFEGVEAVEALPPHVWVGRAKTLGIDWHFSGQDFKDTVAEGFALKR